MKSFFSSWFLVSSALLLGLFLEDTAHEKQLRSLERQNERLRSESFQKGQRIQELSDRLDTETVWLTRALISETHKPQEMRFVAWVIRNRVEARHRGARTYKEVVLDPYQFSAFNPGSKVRTRYIQAQAATEPFLWDTAFEIARDVIEAPPEENPVPGVTHFLSPVSMRSQGIEYPGWYREFDRVPVSEVHPDRFLFFRQG